MKRNGKLKVHRNFKIAKDLDTRLRRHSLRTFRTQTHIVETALREFLAIKR